MKYQVWVLHAVEPQFFGTKKSDQVARGLVARLDIEFPTEVEINTVLEKAFEKTNSIEEHWFNNKEVTASWEKNQRSTMVGDIFMTYDRVFQVEACGFKELTKS